jgi:hypothetical protein
MHPKWLIATAGLLFVVLIASVAFFIGRQASAAGGALPFRRWRRRGPKPQLLRQAAARYRRLRRNQQDSRNRDSSFDCERVLSKCERGCRRGHLAGDGRGARGVGLLQADGSTPSGGPIGDQELSPRP